VACRNELLVLLSSMCCGRYFRYEFLDFLLIEGEDGHILFFVLLRVLEDSAVLAEEVGLDLFEGGIKDNFLEGTNDLIKVNILRRG